MRRCLRGSHLLILEYKLMANRRMFSQRIVGDESFLEMPVSAQNLYFHLGIYADDDGFVNPQKVIRMIGCNPDDLKIVITKGFVIPFKSGVVVITNWKENNYIQADRYTPTIYQEQFKQLDCNNNIYRLEKGNKSIKEIEGEKPEWLKNRQSVMRKSSLPFSFGYKIRNAFIGKKCVVCGNVMEKTSNSRRFIPTIQHNTPLMNGGKHELDNISVICLQCNLSWRDKVIGKDNTEEVCKVWETIVYETDTQVRLGKVRLELGKDKLESKELSKVFYSEFNNVKLSDEEKAKLIERFGGEKNVNILIEELGTYLASTGKRYASHYATLLNWGKRKISDKIKEQNKPSKYQASSINI